MQHDDLWLSALADAILDGSVVDVDHAALDGTDSRRAAIRQAQILVRIAELHRGPPTGQGSPMVASPEDATDPLTSWGRLTIVEEIGRGMFGIVYRAKDSRLNRDVALKLLRPYAGIDPVCDDRLAVSVIEEGRLLARIHHPNVVTIFDADRIAGRVGLTMELIRGRTLEQTLQEHGPFSATEVAAIGTDVCRALAAVHQAGLLHQDIKSQNVMRQHDGRLVLMDFGAGRDRLDQDDACGGELAGTPLYWAPEIFDHHAATVHSDIYAVGVLLYHLLTNTYPVIGGTIRELRERHHSGSRILVQEANAGVPEVLARLIDRALEIKPDNRFATADEIAAALAALNGSVAGAPRRRWPAGAILFTGVATLMTMATVVLNVAGSRDRLLGRPRPLGHSATARGPTVLGDRPVAIRQVLLPGEYVDIGRPSVDGRYLPFLANDAGDVVVKDLETGQTRQLTKGNESAGYADGSPTMSRDSRWVAYPWRGPGGAFDLRVFDLTANPNAPTQPRVLVQRSDVETHPVEWSRDGSEILSVLETKDGARGIALVSAVDGAVRRIKDLGVARPLGVSLSPDGRFVVYDQPQRDNPKARDLFVVATDGSGEWPLVEHPASDMFPYWMSDGERVLFTSDRTGALGLWAIHVFNGRPVTEPEVVSRDMGRMTPIGPTRDGAFYYRLETGLVDVYTVHINPVDGTVMGKPDPVWPNRIGSNISSDWSADGRYLAYVKIRTPPGPAQADPFSRILAIRDVATGQEHEISPALAFFIAPRWSPDGRTILVSGCDLQQHCGLHLVDVETGRLTLTMPGETWPRWTRDGRALLRTKDGHFLMSHDVRTKTEMVFLDIRRLGVDRFTPSAFGTAFEISPDGAFLAFSGWIAQGPTAETVIKVMPIGGAALEVARSGAKEPLFFQGWTPDGFALLFTKGSGDRTAPTKLWRIPAHGGDARPVGLEMLGLRDVHITAAGTMLTFTAGWQTGDVRMMENFLPR